MQAWEPVNWVIRYLHFKLTKIGGILQSLHQSWIFSRWRSSINTLIYCEKWEKEAFNNIPSLSTNRYNSVSIGLLPAKQIWWKYTFSSTITSGLCLGSLFGTLSQYYMNYWSSLIDFLSFFTGPSFNGWYRPFSDSINVSLSYWKTIRKD